MDISDFELFRGLSAENHRRLKQNAQFHHYPAGEIFICRGAMIEYVYFIAHGRVKECTFTLSGKELVFNHLESGDCFGLLTHTGSVSSKSYFIASTEVAAWSLKATEFIRLLREQQTVANFVMVEIRRIMDRLADRLYEIRALDAPARTRAELLRYAHAVDEGDDTEFVAIDNMPTHEEIANTIFTHREAVTREISRLRKSGVLVKMANNRMAANTALLRELTGDTAL